MNDETQNNEAPDEDVLEEAPRRRSLAREFFDYLMDNKKWWLLPIVFMFIVLGLLMILASSGPVAPFIYTLF